MVYKYLFGRIAGVLDIHPAPVPAIRIYAIITKRFKQGSPYLYLVLWLYRDQIKKKKKVQNDTDKKMTWTDQSTCFPSHAHTNKDMTKMKKRFHSWTAWIWSVSFSIKYDN